MPKFGLSMEEGMLTEWLVPIGGAVKRGDPIAVIEAEKLTNDAVASSDGYMLKYCLEPGDSAPCGTPICVIGEKEEALDGAQTPAAANPSAPPEEHRSSGTRTPATPRAQAVIAARGLDADCINGTGRHGEITIDDVRAASASNEQSEPASAVKITPRAKMLAIRQKLSYSHIHGTGLLGMITVADVKAYGEPSAESRLVPMNGIQRATAVAMKKSVEASAQTAVCIESGYAPLVAAYRRLKPVYSGESIKLSYTSMIVYAVSRALSAHENIRYQYFDAKNFVLPDAIDIGVAIDTENGLLVPAVRNADRKMLREICREIADLSARAQNGKLNESDFGGTVTTVTNLANAGVTLFTPILNPPESTILGVCKLRNTPVVKDEGIYIEPVMNLCLTYDHRVINGVPAGRYLQTIIDLLNQTNWK